MRTIKYFGLQAEKMFALVLAFGGAYSILFSSFTSEDPGRISISYLFIMGITAVITSQSGMIRLTMPLILSFGCRRKEVFLGTQWYMFLLIVQSQIVFVLLRLFMPALVKTGADASIEIVALAVLIGAGALSEIIAILTLKFNKITAMIGIICGSSVGIICYTVLIPKPVDLHLPENFEYMILAGVVLIYAAAAVIYYRMWSKYELKPL